MSMDKFTQVYRAKLLQLAEHHEKAAKESSNNADFQLQAYTLAQVYYEIVEIIDDTSRELGG